MELFHAKHKTEFCMKMKALVAALALSVVGLAMAQPATPNLDKREAHQQQRINQGVASGQLNAKEANRLQQRESKLAADEAAAKADGKVTRAERRRLQREADRDSRAIHKQKHDRQTAASAAGK
jgi:Skp family chaperone for outer membrane proteins